MRFILTSLRFAFNEMKFIQLKPFEFSTPNLDVTKNTSKSIFQNQGSGLQVVDQVCKYFPLFSNGLCSLQR